ncbi:MAG: class II aldolase/adducin family protein [Pirellulales bacterium]
MLSYDALLHPRDELAATIETIYRFRMTTTSGGNLSIRTSEGDIWITPARVDKGQLTRDDIVVVRTDGRVEGKHRPSSEYPFHLATYQSGADIGAVVHAHPVALVAFSIARQVPDTHLFRQAFDVCGDVGFAPYALPGSDQLGQNIARAFEQGFRCVVLENHGVVVAGCHLQNAFQKFETLEFTAKTEIMARQLGKVHYLTEDQLCLAEKTNWLPTDPTPLEVSVEEKELRRQLCNFVRRGYQQRLLISTEGTFSARMGEDDFLITPYRANRAKLQLGDLVRVKQGVAFTQGKPSRATAVHRALYQMHPQVNSIVNAYPVHASAFCVTRAELDARTIPESYLFLRDIQRIPFGLQFTSPETIAATISMANPVALLENDGALVLGASILDTFDRLEVLETTAEAILNAAPLGPVQAMSDEVIDELKAAFDK